MSLSLVILAAGMGSRFGGDKPLAEVGPNGQSLFEYSVHDAFKAGFKHVIFVVNDQQDTSQFSARLQGYGDELKIEFVVQSLTVLVKPINIAQTLNENIKVRKNAPTTTVRTKPWGTAHAVLVCREYIHNPFVVINADDYYGQENYKKIGHYLLANCRNPKTCVLPGYRLGNTLSTSGGVNRGICEVDSDGFLESIREVRNISFDQSMSLHADQSDEHLSIKNSSIVSMTFWGFMPSIFNIFENEFQVFLNETSDLGQDEFYIPDTVNLGIKSGLLQVRVFDTSEKWKGLTYAQDVTDVRGFILKLTDAGVYTSMGNP